MDDLIAQAKRIDAQTETMVAWLLTTEPRMRDEPQAFKAAILRLGIKAALSPKLDALRLADVSVADTLTALQTRADRHSAERLEALNCNAKQAQKIAILERRLITARREAFEEAASEFDKHAAEAMAKKESLAEYVNEFEAGCLNTSPLTWRNAANVARALATKEQT